LTPVSLVLGLLLSQAAVEPASQALAEGAARYEHRAQGARGPIARPEPIEAAIAAYRRALVLEPDSVEGSLGLLRALFFRGGFTDVDPDTERRVFAEARDVAVVAVARLEKRVGKLEGKARIVALRKVPGAAALFVWAGISWGQWAISTSKLAAARQGAAARIRDLGETSLAIDEGLEQGSAHVLLGRLHDQSPRIPFLTFWISRKAALRHLEAAHAMSPGNTLAQYFLAEALLRRAPERTAEAKRLLQECASATPRPDFLVEDAHYAAQARQRLDELESR
jgi:tetratricopeptide (TPR) repeat protein